MEDKRYYIIVTGVGTCYSPALADHLCAVIKEYIKPIIIEEPPKTILEQLIEEESKNFLIKIEPYVHKFDNFIDPILEEEILDNKRNIYHRARSKQWTGKQFKQKNNRRQNRIAYNHGKHRKK